jgi:hypothetical protein
MIRQRFNSNISIVLLLQTGNKLGDGVLQLYFVLTQLYCEGCDQLRRTSDADLGVEERLINFTTGSRVLIFEYGSVTDRGLDCEGRIS